MASTSNSASNKLGREANMKKIEVFYDGCQEPWIWFGSTIEELDKFVRDRLCNEKEDTKIQLKTMVNEKEIISLEQLQSGDKVCVFKDGKAPVFDSQMEIDVCPEPSLRKDMGNLNYSLVPALCEAIDNSVDASAKFPERTVEVIIDLERKVMKVQDNGVGMTPNEVESWGKLSSRGGAFQKNNTANNLFDVDNLHDTNTVDNTKFATKPKFSFDFDFESFFDSFLPKHITGELGRYGVGIKYSLCRLGDRFEVESKAANCRYVARMSWEKESDTWKAPGGPRAANEEELKKDHFTVLTVNGLDSDLFKRYRNDQRAIVRAMAKDLMNIYFLRLGGYKILRDNLCRIFKLKTHASDEELPNKGSGSVQFALSINNTHLNDLDCVARRYLEAAVDCFTVSFVVQPEGKPATLVKGLIFYYPFTNGKESLPQSDGDFEDPTDTEPKPGILYFWMGRLLPDTKPEMLDFMVHKTGKDQSNLPERCRSRVKGFFFFDRCFQATQNKTELTQGDYFQAFKQICRETSLKTRYTNWLKKCHGQYDEEVIFEGNPIYHPESNETRYDKVTLGKDVFSAKSYVKFGKVPTEVGRILYFFHAGRPLSNSIGYAQIEIWKHKHIETRQVQIESSQMMPMSASEFQEFVKKARSGYPNKLAIYVQKDWRKEIEEAKNPAVTAAFDDKHNCFTIVAGEKLPHLHLVLQNENLENRTELFKNEKITFDVSAQGPSMAEEKLKYESTIETKSKKNIFIRLNCQKAFAKVGNYQMIIRMNDLDIAPCIFKFVVLPDKLAAISLELMENVGTISLDRPLPKLRITGNDKYSNLVPFKNVPAIKVISNFGNLQNETNRREAQIVLEEGRLVVTSLHIEDLVFQEGKKQQEVGIHFELDKIKSNTINLTFSEGKPCRMRLSNDVFAEHTFENKTTVRDPVFYLEDKYGNRCFTLTDAYTLKVFGSCIEGIEVDAALNQKGELKASMKSQKLSTVCFDPRTGAEKLSGEIEFVGAPLYTDTKQQRTYYGAFRKKTQANTSMSTLFSIGDTVAVGTVNGEEIARIAKIFKSGDKKQILIQWFYNTKALEDKELPIDVEDHQVFLSDHFEDYDIAMVSKHVLVCSPGSFDEMFFKKNIISPKYMYFSKYFYVCQKGAFQLNPLCVLHPSIESVKPEKPTHRKLSVVLKWIDVNLEEHKETVELESERSFALKFDEFCRKRKSCLESCSFVYNNYRVDPAQTPAQIGIKNNDTIYVADNKLVIDDRNDYITFQLCDARQNTIEIINAKLRIMPSKIPSALRVTANENATYKIIENYPVQGCLNLMAPVGTVIDDLKVEVLNEVQDLCEAVKASLTFAWAPKQKLALKDHSSAIAPPYTMQADPKEARYDISLSYPGQQPIHTAVAFCARAGTPAQLKTIFVADEVISVVSEEPIKQLDLKLYDKHGATYSETDIIENPELKQQLDSFQITVDSAFHDEGKLVLLSTEKLKINRPFKDRGAPGHFILNNLVIEGSEGLVNLVIKSKYTTINGDVVSLSDLLVPVLLKPGKASKLVHNLSQLVQVYNTETIPPFMVSLADRYDNLITNSDIRVRLIPSDHKNLKLQCADSYDLVKGTCHLDNVKVTLPTGKPGNYNIDIAAVGKRDIQSTTLTINVSVIAQPKTIKLLSAWNSVIQAGDDLSSVELELQIIADDDSIMKPSMNSFTVSMLQNNTVLSQKKPTKPKMTDSNSVRFSLPVSKTPTMKGNYMIEIKYLTAAPLMLDFAVKPVPKIHTLQLAEQFESVMILKDPVNHNESVIKDRFVCQLFDKFNNVLTPADLGGAEPPKITATAVPLGSQHNHLTGTTTKTLHGDSVQFSTADNWIIKSEAPFGTYELKISVEGNSEVAPIVRKFRVQDELARKHLSDRIAKIDEEIQKHQNELVQKSKVVAQLKSQMDTTTQKYKIVQEKMKHVKEAQQRVEEYKKIYDSESRRPVRAQAVVKRANPAVTAVLQTRANNNANQFVNIKTHLLGAVAELGSVDFTADQLGGPLPNDTRHPADILADTLASFLGAKLHTLIIDAFWKERCKRPDMKLSPNEIFKAETAARDEIMEVCKELNQTRIKRMGTINDKAYPHVDVRHPQRLLNLPRIDFPAPRCLGYAVNLIHLDEKGLALGLRERLWWNLLGQTLVFRTKKDADDYQQTRGGKIERNMISLDGYVALKEGDEIAGKDTKGLLSILGGVQFDIRQGVASVKAKLKEYEAELENSMNEIKALPQLEKDLQETKAKLEQETKDFEHFRDAVCKPKLRELEQEKTKLYEQSMRISGHQNAEPDTDENNNNNNNEANGSGSSRKRMRR